MKKLSKINETIWGRSMERALGNETRKEDDLGFDALKPLDLGLSVLWADRDLKRPLSMGEIKKIKFPNGWRLPERAETAGLCNIIGSYGDYEVSDSEGIYYKFNGHRIKFDIFHKNYRFWTSTKSKSGYWTFSIPPLQLLPELGVISGDNEFSVRLVKEKV